MNARLLEIAVRFPGAVHPADPPAVRIGGVRGDPHLPERRRIDRPHMSRRVGDQHGIVRGGAVERLPAGVAALLQVVVIIAEPADPFARLHPALFPVVRDPFDHLRDLPAPLEGYEPEGLRAGGDVAVRVDEGGHQRASPQVRALRAREGGQQRLLRPQLPDDPVLHKQRLGASAAFEREDVPAVINRPFHTAPPFWFPHYSTTARWENPIEKPPGVSRAARPLWVIGAAPFRPRRPRISESGRTPPRPSSSFFRRARAASAAAGPARRAGGPCWGRGRASPPSRPHRRG